ncbi:hypothetical protein ACNJ8R_004152 [Cronobacter sakazakii]|nr:hypothetical protein [Cronobacter sakazakii]ELY4007641.1 hypothetical protein [Cronobacter dublinensis]EJV9557844.1 hypothetical protein [Cronobacter sakazakii]EJV9561899.1 hypothetical protein [Cronobacter sakazakii]EJX1223093.1 hypothetical protein [Cronobacter sakazakii]
MWNNATQDIEYKTVVPGYYTLGDFADELINILSRSPEAFVHLLRLSLSKRFGDSEADVHAMIGYIANAVGEDELKKQLATADLSIALPVTERPEVSPDVMRLIDPDGLRLAVILARHMYCDLSETNMQQKKTSEAVLRAGQGAFVTSFHIDGKVVQVTTQLPSARPYIELL